jgi:uncharacterized protein (DUF433 family)
VPGTIAAALRCFSAMDSRTRIVADPNIASGRACVTGTRVPVSVVLDNLAAGLTAGEVVASYPSLTEEDVRACLAYAAELVRVTR